MKFPAAIALAAACVVCCACGSSATSTAPPPTTNGAVLFAGNCAACHSVIGNESEHKQGGDLLGYHMTASQLLLWSKTMPTRPLTQAQLRAIVNYVLRVQSRTGS